MGKYFGTDGIRGLANKELTPELALKLGRAVGTVIRKKNKEKNSILIIGKDSRLSGDMLESALTAGLTATGISVIQAGVLPTPAIAWLVEKLQLEGGAMISASHNPYYDNGIKFFANTGFKFSEANELEVERLLEIDIANDEFIAESHGGVGRIINGHAESSLLLYKSHLKSSVTQNLAGIKIVMDCANGAASQVAPLVFTELGAEVVSINCLPDGVNINEQCGSTDVKQLVKEVLKQENAIGLAFDGDADRLMAIDELGNVVDGDYILALCGSDLKDRGKLRDNTIVTTVMANMGFFVAMREQGLATKKTDVGDKYVLTEMLKHDYDLGGEQSGHVIFKKYSKTGDGILTALQLVDLVKRKKKSLHELCSIMRKYPQLLVNVKVKDKAKIMQNAKVKAAIAKAEAELGTDGRLLVRPSGTEPLLRIMAEAPEPEKLQKIVQAVAAVVESE